MSQDDPLLIIVSLFATIYFGKEWLKEYRNPQEVPEAPGATSAPFAILLIAVVGSLVLLAAETYGEIHFEIVEEQTEITYLFLVAMVCAAFIEEYIFRGYLVITNKGKGVLFLICVLGSLLFALIHPYIWQVSEDLPWWKLWEGSVQLDLGLKAVFSTFFIFINSLFFYALRFINMNPKQSLIPCFLAHLVKNLGVFIIKLIQGKVTGLY